MTGIAADATMDLVDAAERILRASSGTDALARCEWEPVADLDDVDALAALGALFRAQGRSLAVTPALGLLAGMALRGSPCCAGLDASAYGDRVRFLAVGGVSGRRIVLDVPDRGVCAADAEAVSEDAGGVALEPELVQRLSLPKSALEPLLLSAGEAEAARGRMDALVRVAISHELLGVCDALLRSAVDYAAARIQFGQPIGSFQAVQHLLADAAVDARSLDAACRAAVARPLAADGTDQMALYLKALAGRAARRVVQATLQTFGAIGFTWEHDHHRFARRAMTLDAITDTTDELSRKIGQRARGQAVWRSVTSY
jgi:hypothetical protein